MLPWASSNPKWIHSPTPPLSPSPNLPHEGSRHKLRPQDLDTNSLSLSCTRLDPSRKAAQPGARRPAASLTHLGTRRSERACVSTRGRYGDPLVRDLHGRQVDPRHRPGHGPPWIHHLGRPPLRGAAYASVSPHSHLLRPPIRRWLFAPACGCFLPRMGSDLRLIIILILMWCGASCIPLFSSSCSSLRTC